MFSLHIHKRDTVLLQAILRALYRLEAKMATFQDVQNEVTEVLREIQEAIVALQNSGTSPTDAEYQDIVDKLSAARSALDTAGQPKTNPADTGSQSQAEIDAQAVKDQTAAENAVKSTAQTRAKFDPNNPSANKTNG